MNDITYGEPRPEAVRDLSQTLATQQLAGSTATEELARNFLARVQRDIDEQVDLRVRQQVATIKPPQGSSSSDVKQVAITSLVIGALLTVAKATDLGAGGIAIVWSALVIVNVLWAVVWLVRR